MAYVLVDSGTYGLNSNMTVSWGVPWVISSSNPVGIWLFEVDKNYDPQDPPPWTWNKWPLIYSANPSLKSYTINLGKVLKSIPDGQPINEGNFYTVVLYNVDGTMFGALQNTIAITTNDLSLGKVLEGGNVASTDIDMLGYAIVSSSGNVEIA